MSTLSRRFWRKKANRLLKKWDNRKCLAGSRKFFKLNAKAEQASIIVQMLDTMDAEVAAAIKQTWALMSKECKHNHVSMRIGSAVCAHDGWSDMPVCYQGRCPLLKKERQR